MEKLKKTIYNGSWMGRGGCNYNYMAGGHMNAAGVHCLTFLLMARECGMDGGFGRGAKGQDVASFLVCKLRESETP